mgnify:CR=1 FL=1
MSAKRPERRAAQMVQAMAAESRDHLFGTSSDLKTLFEVDVDRLHRKPNQPRTVFSDTELDELGDSLIRHGQLMPILVRPHPELDREWIIDSGERRWRAAQRRGIKTLLALQTSGDPDEVSLIENEQRVDLDPIDRGNDYRRLMEKHGWSQRELAKAMCKPQPEIARMVAIAHLPADILDEYRADSEQRVSKAVLAEIASAPDDLQHELWRRAKEGATVRVLRDAKRSAANPSDLAPGDTTSYREEQRGSSSVVSPGPTGGANGAGEIGKIFTALAKHLVALKRVDRVTDPTQREQLAELRRHIDLLLDQA